LHASPGFCAKSREIRLRIALAASARKKGVPKIQVLDSSNNSELLCISLAIWKHGFHGAELLFVFLEEKLLFVLRYVWFMLRKIVNQTFSS